MAIFKFLGSWMLAVATLVLINDVTRGVVPGGRLTFLSMRGLWQMIHDGSLATVQSAVQRGVHPLAWDPVLIGLLKLPAWFLLGLVGGLLCYAGRNRRRVDIFTN